VNNFLRLFLFLLLPQIAWAGTCNEIQRVCSEGAEERVIDGHKVYRDCWKYETTKQCTGYAANNCQPLKDEGCVQSESRCKERNDKGWCLIYEQTYLCESQERYKRIETRYRLPTYKEEAYNNKRNISCDEQIKCLDGKCFHQVYEASNEMEQAIAMLHALKGLQKKYSEDPIIIFQGHEGYCKKKAWGLNNCCKPGKATVEKMKLSECAAEERSLVDKRAKGLCHYIGQYKRKTLGITKYTKHSYCCFDSKLVKAIQVGGKAQLGRNFGSAKTPDCSGLTVDDLQKIDFSKIDFTDLFAEIFATHKPQDSIKIKQSLETELKVIQESLKTPKIEGQNPKYNEEGIL
jgi:conjugal transfer mating pair stabilization protein TraN